MAGRNGSTIATAAITRQQARPATHREDPLLTIKEVADMIGVDHSTVWRWCQPQNRRKRRLRAIRYPGGSFRIRKSTVDQILLGTAAPDEPIPYEEE